MPYSQTPSAYVPPLNVSDQVSHPYIITDITEIKGDGVDWIHLAKDTEELL